MFRSLSSYNYRLWAAGSLVSNVGTWMQRTAQDWIVLTQLTDHDAAALGIVMALQFGPLFLLLPLTGLAADRFPQLVMLKITQSLMAAIGLVLAILTITHTVQLWHVYLLSFLLGCVQAFDTPVRQTFVTQLAGGANLSNAVGLNSASFNLARTVGPAVAGILIAVIGSGWVFLINVVSFGMVLASLFLLRTSELQSPVRAKSKKGNLAGGLRYVRGRPDIVLILVVIFIFGSFGVNFPIYIATMSTVVFHSGATGFGVLSSIIAIGSIVGALLSAQREKPRLRYLFIASSIFAAGCTAAAFAPGYWYFAAALVALGLASQTLMTTANSYIQLSTPAAVRGRVMAIYFALFAGTTPIGAPIVGWVANEFGPRWALGVGAGAGLACTIVGLVWLIRFHNLRVTIADRRLRFSYGRAGRERAAEEIVTEEITTIKG